MTNLEIAVGSYGIAYNIWFRDVDYSTLTPLLYVWRGSNTIINGVTCDVTLIGNDTKVTYLVPEGAFDVDAGVYNAKIKFVGANIEYEERMFNWTVYDQS